MFLEVNNNHLLAFTISVNQSYFTSVDLNDPTSTSMTLKEPTFIPLLQAINVKFLNYTMAFFSSLPLFVCIMAVALIAPVWLHMCVSLPNSRIVNC